MKRTAKLAKQKRAARELAEIFCAALQRFPKSERKRKIREFQRIADRRSKP
jgi:hypothetical protein